MSSTNGVRRALEEDPVGLHHVVGLVDLDAFELERRADELAESDVVVDDEDVKLIHVCLRCGSGASFVRRQTRARSEASGPNPDHESLEGGRPSTGSATEPRASPGGLVAPPPPVSPPAPAAHVPGADLSAQAMSGDSHRDKSVTRPSRATKPLLRRWPFGHVRGQSPCFPFACPARCRIAGGPTIRP